jgi:hypothetical protein
MADDTRSHTCAFHPKLESVGLGRDVFYPFPSPTFFKVLAGFGFRGSYKIIM